MVAASIWFGAPWLTVLIAVVAVQGVREFYRLRPKGIPPLPSVLGAIWAMAFVIGAQASSSLGNFLVISLIILAVGTFVCLLWFIAYYTAGKSLTASLYLLAGPVYIGFLLAHSLVLWEIGDPVGDSVGDSLGDSISGAIVVSGHAGRDWLLLTILIVFATDTGAYLVGKAFGSRPLAPVISPNKTWEGAIGGLFSALVIAIVVGFLLDLTTPKWQQVVVGATVGVISQFGDLFESKLKRMSNAKDAGSIIPGHGGVLDRLDSVVVSIPVVYYLLSTVFDP